jgi:hypothetical protein
MNSSSISRPQKALELTLTPSLLARADKVIEWAPGSK